MEEPTQKELKETFENGKKSGINYSIVRGEKAMFQIDLELCKLDLYRG